MHAKSFITSSESLITIHVNESDSYTCNLTADGQMGFELKGGDEVNITKSKRSIKIVRIAGSALYNTLRSKIYYRNGDENET